MIQYYSTNTGHIMGNPFSPLLAESFLDEIERNVHKDPLMSTFVYWY